MRIFSVSTRTCAIALIAAAAIGLTACGGGDGGLSRGEAEELQAQLDAAVAQAAADAAARAAAEAQAAADKAAREAAETQAAADRAARETAEAEAAAAKSAQAAAEAAQAAAEAQAQADVKAAQDAAAEDVAAAQAEADKAKEAAQTAMAAADKAKEDLADAQGAQLRAERAKAEAERQLRLAQQDARTKEQQRLAAEAEKERLMREAERQREQLEQQLTEAEQAELRARASRFGTELDLGDGTNPGTGTPGTATAGVMASATVSWTRGNTLTFRPTGVTHTPGSSAPSVAGSWRSASFTGQSGTATALTDETVYLYTNIQAPSSRAFWKEHNVGVAATAFGDLEADTDNDPTPTGTARVVRVGNSLDYADGTTYNITVPGTFDGVSGTYTCADCTIADGDDADSTITAADFDADDWVTLGDGERSFVTGDWRFKPGSINSRVKAEDQADQDDAFLYFGVWSSIPDSIAGTYNFRYIAHGGAQTGSALLATTDGLAGFDALTGSATFRGGAIGKYVTQGQVGGQNAKIGTFTATATLNANFDAGSDQGEISGHITDFREGGSPLTGWRVTLGGTGAGVAGNIELSDTDDDASGITVADIGGLSVGGSWGANFYGSNNQLLSDRDKYSATQYPPVDLAGVAGWFDATTGPTGTTAAASLAGAFAATPSN